MKFRHAASLHIEPPLPFPAESFDYARTLHGSTGEAIVFLCARTGPRNWKEYPVPVHELESFVREFGIRQDVYISQGRFTEPRRKVHLLSSVNALWVDVDFYRDESLENCHPLYVLELALDRLTREKIPEPSCVIGSGRGLYLLWFHSPIEFSSLFTWKMCQRRLHKTLLDLRSDHNVLHAASVLRVPGSQNSKSQTLVEILRKSPDVWNFDDLADEINAQPETTHSRTLGKVTYLHVRRWNGGTLWAKRLSDIRKLIKYRWPHGVPSGMRNDVLFLYSIGLSWLVEPSRIKAELSDFASHTIRNRKQWTDSDERFTFTASLERALRAAKGETVEWAGQTIDPRYRMKNETILERLQISTPEARELNLEILLPEELYREKDARRKQTSRGGSPPIQTDTCLTYQTRQNYEENSLSRLKPWEALGISRATYYRRKTQGKL